MSEKTPENKYAFFQHRECEYFPCHKTNDPDNFNCLFCYCPLYALGKKCGGNFVYNEHGFKDCSKCTFPHRRANFEKVTERYRDILEIVKAQDEKAEC